MRTTCTRTCVRTHTHTNIQWCCNCDCVPNVITKALLCVCSCIPFCHPHYFNSVLIPPTEAQVITYVQHRSTLQYSKRLGGEKSSSGSVHCVCLCSTTEQKNDAAATSFAHSCCFLSDNAGGQWPTRCPGILTPIRDCALYGGSLISEYMKEAWGTVDLTGY